MRWIVLAIGILVAGLIGLGQQVSENATSNDGGVPWPIDVLQDGSVPYPLNEEAISFPCPIPLVARCFLEDRLLVCSHEFVYPGIRCVSGAPVPQQYLEAEKD
jgi:hypothetical protein